MAPRNSPRTRGWSLQDAMVAVGGPTDLTSTLGFPLALTVIGEILGVPDSDRGQFRAWSDGMLVGADRAEEGMAALMAMFGYTKELLARRRREPADDLTTAMAQAATHTGVTDDDAAMLAIAIIVGGWETTAAALGSGTYRLLTTRHSDGTSMYRYLHANPELVPAAVEELLRTVPSTYLGCGQPRRASRDITIAGVAIKAGELVIPAHDAANRDPEVFPDPYRFDPGRSNASRHLSFGHGAHACLGAPLARLELQLMFGALTARLPDLRLAVPAEALRWDTSMIIRRPAQVPVTWGRDGDRPA